MKNVIFIDVSDVISEKEQTFAIITNDDGSTTSMTKAHYDAQQVEHLTSPLTDPTA